MLFKSEDLEILNWKSASERYDSRCSENELSDLVFTSREMQLSKTDAEESKSNIYSDIKSARNTEYRYHL